MAYGAIFGQTPKIPEVYNIGDIKATVRTDLGDKWLLCNGDYVSKETYPDIEKLIEYSFDNEKDVYNLRLDTRQKSSNGWCVAANDEYIVRATLYNDEVGVLYSNAVSGDFIYKALKSNLSISGTIQVCKYLNGYFIVAFQDMWKSEVTFFYTTDPTGTWNEKIFSVPNLYDINSIAVGLKWMNNKYVFFGQTAQNKIWTYALSTLSGTGYLETHTMSFLFYGFFDMEYFNGKYWYLMQNRSKYTSTPYQIVLCSSTYLSGTPTTKYRVPARISASSTFMGSMFVASGKLFVMLGYSYDPVGTHVYYTSDGTSFTDVIIESINDFSQDYIGCMNVMKIDDTHYVAFYVTDSNDYFPRLAFINTETCEITGEKLDRSSNYTINFHSNACYFKNRIWVPAIYSSAPYLYYWPYGKKLPTAIIDGAYAYIKAKE